ncbi:hypothetical protein EON82_01765 [bacterium]|nr:MAG: hypothetical protein EON82_01765 [bacterium]
MNGFWDEELTPEETDQLLDKAAAEIRKRRMEAPAIIALEMHKPLASIASHAVVAFSPFMIPFFGYDGVHDMSRLLKDRRNVESLIQRLECSAEDVPVDKE